MPNVMYKNVKSHIMFIKTSFRCTLEVLCNEEVHENDRRIKGESYVSFEVFCDDNKTHQL